jgi:hypothetical protein
LKPARSVVRVFIAASYQRPGGSGWGLKPDFSVVLVFIGFSGWVSVGDAFP